MRNFFKLIKYEIVKVYRNKLMIILLFLLSTLLLISMSFSPRDNKKLNVDIGIYTDGLLLNECQIKDVLEGNLGEQDWKQYATIDKGKQQVNNGEIDIFIEVDNSSKPQKVIVYYDETNNYAVSVTNKLSKESDKVIYENMVDGLASIGFIVNEDYFDVMDFEKTNKTNITDRSKQFGLIIMVSVGIVLTFGLAYSMTRDNENNTIRNILYMPMGENRYLLSKMIPYILLGFIQLILAFLIGSTLYNIDYQVNIILLLSVSMLYVLAITALGLLLSMLKSQISTALIATFILLYPVFDSVTYVSRSLPAFAGYLTYVLPGKVFVSVLNGLMFNANILWYQVGCLVVQMIAFYLTAYIILKRKLSR